jgi:hypothetical protein
MAAIEKRRRQVSCQVPPNNALDEPPYRICHAACIRNLHASRLAQQSSGVISLSPLVGSLLRRQRHDSTPATPVDDGQQAEQYHAYTSGAGTAAFCWRR